MENKKSGIMAYEEAESFTLFSKAFYEDEIDSVFYPEHKKVSLFFNKINNETCRECVSGRVFYRTHDNCFYNAESGLYFDFSTGFQKSNADLDKVIDEDYKKTIFEYFDKHIKLKKMDEDFALKTETMLAKKSIYYRG